MTYKKYIHDEEYMELDHICFHGCKNRNDEIYKDWYFEKIYDWMELVVDEEKAAKEYRRMVNGFRMRMGWDEYN